MSTKHINYLTTSQASWYWTIVVVSIVTLFSAFFIPADAVPFSFLRNIFGLLFVFLLPGFAFLKAVFPQGFLGKESSEALVLIVHFAVSIGLSVALAPMVGLFLYYTQLGFSVYSVTLGLLIFTVVVATAGILREAKTKQQL
jgi:uncharacterized membrane protein